jgi:flagellar basal-body rod modification protein FlgD
MNTISAATVGDQYAIDNQQTKPTYNKELGQDEFLELMTAQLKNQDPMEPMDNGEFLGQMAQFSTVSGIEKMQTSLETLSTTYATGQTLQSVQLVGQEVLIENNSLELADSGSTGGSFELDATSGNVMLNIADASGTVIRQINQGEFAAGRHPFTWDGKDQRGERMPAGTYTAEVSTQQGDEFLAASVLTTRIVDSVEFGAGGKATLNTQQGDVLTLADIRQIRSGSTAASNKNQ